MSVSVRSPLVHENNVIKEKNDECVCVRVLCVCVLCVCVCVCVVVVLEQHIPQCEENLFDCSESVGRLGSNVV